MSNICFVGYEGNWNDDSRLEVITDREGSALHTHFRSLDKYGTEFDLLQILELNPDLICRENSDTESWRLQTTFALCQLGFKVIRNDLITREINYSNPDVIGRFLVDVGGRVVSLFYPMVRNQLVVAYDYASSHAITFEIPLTYGIERGQLESPFVCRAFLLNGLKVKRFSSHVQGNFVQDLEEFVLFFEDKPFRSKLVGRSKQRPVEVSLALLFSKHNPYSVSWTESGEDHNRPMRTYNILNPLEIKL